jgi:hypothetical protein
MPALLSLKQSTRASKSEIGSVKSLRDVKRLQVGQPKARLKGTCDISEEGPYRGSIERVAFSAITSERKTCAERFDCRFAWCHCETASVSQCSSRIDIGDDS